MNRIEDYQAFTAIVEKRNLTAAAHHLGRSLQAVSRSLAALEVDIGVELIRRTTRRSNPTDAGLAFYHRISAALAEIEAAKLETSNRRAEATGMLRIASSTGFASYYVIPALPEFLAANPKINVEVDLSDRRVDLIGEGFDLAIRVGQLPDSTLTARLLANSRRVVFASPGYIAKNGRPRTPEDLVHHECIVWANIRDSDIWSFKMNGRPRGIKVAGRLRTSGVVAVNAAVIAGLGIGSGPLWQVKSLVDRGDVELLLTRFERPPLPIHAVWPATKVLPARTQKFVEFLSSRLKVQL